MDQRFFQPLRIFALKLAELAYFWTIQPGIQFILPLKLGVEFYSKEGITAFNFPYISVFNKAELNEYSGVDTFGLE